MLPESFKNRLIQWLEDHREFVVAVFCLPASFLFTVLLRVRAYVRWLTSDPQRHDSAVRLIQSQVIKDFYYPLYGKMLSLYNCRVPK